MNEYRNSVAVELMTGERETEPETILEKMEEIQEQVEELKELKK